MVLVYSTSKSLERREGLPVLNQWASWAIIGMTIEPDDDSALIHITFLGTSTLLPFIHRGPHDEHYLARLLSICLAFAPLMTLLSISYEMLFYVCFCSTILLWLETERRLYYGMRTTTKRPMQASDVRAALMFMFFIQVAFFGTGNVASLSSFSLSSVYRFVTVFNPFSMTALLITKILIPFCVVSAVLGVLSVSLDLGSFSLLLTVMAVSDVQTINFFYFVTDYGSWLEIGMSISHFCISELFIIFSIILFLLSQLLVGHLTVPRLTKDKSS